MSIRKGTLLEYIGEAETKHEGHCLYYKGTVYYKDYNRERHRIDYQPKHDYDVKTKHL